MGVAWVAQLVNRPTLGFSWVMISWVMGLSPMSGSMLGGESAWRFSPSAPHLK